jgi:hypothetical protein
MNKITSGKKNEGENFEKNITGGAGGGGGLVRC